MTQKWVYALIASLATIFLTTFYITQIHNIPVQQFAVQEDIFLTEYIIDGLHLEIVEQPEDRYKGLGSRLHMLDTEAMLFVFPELDRHGIWMKDMHFAIDIIWLDADGVIVDISTEISPETYPEIFYPQSKSLYVLECTSGCVTRYGFDIGERILKHVEK